MTVCRACGFHNEPGATFCGSCGAFLEWTSEGPGPGGGATPPTPPTAPTGPGGSTPIPPTGPGGSSAGGSGGSGAGRAVLVPPTVNLEPSTVAVEPGGEATVRLDAHNRSGVVDQFTAEVSGVPPAWVDVQPPVLSLFPDDRGSLAITFRPPRASSPPAGAIAFRVIVRSAADPSVVAAADGVLELGAFTQLAVEVAPHTSKGKWSGQHRITVRNEGNVAVAAALTGKDEENSLDYRFRPDVVRAEPGSQGGADLRAKPRTRIWFGSVKWHRFEVTAVADGAEPLAVDAVMEQNKIIPTWLPRAAMAVAVLGVGAIILRSTVFEPKTENANATGSTTVPTAPTTLPPSTPAASTTTPGGGSTTAPQNTTSTTATTLPKVVFTSYRSGDEQVWTMNSNGTSPTKLTALGTSNGQAAWSPDRKQIAFVSNRDGNPEIYLMNADGTNQHRLTNDAKSDQYPRWSPDGKRIVFASNRAPETTGFDLWVVNADGSGTPFQLTNTPGIVDRKATWSPDGTKVAWERGAAPASQIWVVGVSAGGGPLTITTPAAMLAPGQSPSWSPDGAKIALATNVVAAQIATMAAAGGPLTPLTTSAGGNVDPWWSQDGGRIVFTSGRDGNDEIYVMPVSGNPQTRLTTTGGAAPQNQDQLPQL